MLSIEQARTLLEREFPSWDPFSLSPISGGLTNQNLLIETSLGDKFVARLPGENTELFGIDRQREYEISRVAWGIGIAPEPIAFLSEQEILVTRFVESKSIDTADSNVTKLVANILKKLHSAPVVSGEFDLPLVINDYIRTAKNYGVEHPPELNEALDVSKRIIDACGRYSRQWVPCHNDLIAANFLQSQDRIYLLDWEYAAMGDPYVDLGNCAANFCMDDAACVLFMESYLEKKPGDDDVAQLHLLRVLSDLREALWSYVQVGVSTLDVDFHAYGMKHLDRFLHNSRSDEFKTWIDTISD